MPGNRREAALKSAVMVELRRQAPDFLCLLMMSAGAPDRMIAGDGKVTFWEFKHGAPKFSSSGLQELVCMRLEKLAYCRYVIWQERADGGDKHTVVVKPRAFHEAWLKKEKPEVEERFEGFNHQKVVAFIRKVHSS